MIPPGSANPVATPSIPIAKRTSGPATVTDPITTNPVAIAVCAAVFDK